MRKFTLDTIFRTRLQHRPGQLARVTAAIAEEGALIGDITTVQIGESYTLRDITVETGDEGHTARVADRLRALEGVELIHLVDRVFDVHRGGKLHSHSRVPLEQLDDLRKIYTPGVARVAQAIEKSPELAWEYTGLGNSVGIYTNGTRVLGLGNIGVLASLPVMEGKAVLYDRFVKISATPILVDTSDPREFIETVVRTSRSFGAIHLEDIRTPECFVIEQELKARLQKPVMHDDQQGTATAALAGILNACKLTGLDLRTARLGQIGLGAAGSAIATLAIQYGAKQVLVTDTSPEAMKRLEAQGAHPTDLATLMREADIVVATTGRAGLIKPELVRKGQVIFALSNPAPEISPDQARDAGAAFAADGRSINNALAFPGIFKGVLTARSRQITTQMFLEAAEAIAGMADEGELVPSALNPRVHETVTQLVIRIAKAAGLENTARL